MAQFTSHGRMELLFNGDGRARRSYGLDSSNEQPLHSATATTTKLRSFQLHKRSRLGFLIGSSSTSKLYSSRSTSSPSNRSRYRRNDDSRRKVKHEECSYDESDEDDNDDGSEFENEDGLACFRGLVLDISYRPVNVVCWRRAICLEFTEKADVLEYYDQTVNSPSGSFYIPAVLRVPHLLQVVKRRRIRTNLSRKNILYRDNYTCQYCSSCENLTIDHVLPIARGGEWTWENLVAACSKCNSRKGQKTPEEANMKLVKNPKVPKDYDILAIPLTSAAVRMLRLRNGTPEEWRQYLAPGSEP